MNVEIGAEAAQFPEKEYINGIAGTKYDRTSVSSSCPPKLLGLRNLGNEVNHARTKNSVWIT